MKATKAEADLKEKDNKTKISVGLEMNVTKLESS